MKKTKSWETMTNQKQSVYYRYEERSGTNGPCDSHNSKYARTNAHYTLALVEEDRYGKTD